MTAQDGAGRDWRILRGASSIELMETVADDDHENGSVVLRTDHDNLLALARAICPSDHRVVEAGDDLETARLRAALAVSAAFVHAFGYYRATVCGDDAEAWDAVISAHDALLGADGGNAT